MKKGQLAGLENVIISLVIVAVVLGAGIFAVITFNTSLNSSEASTPIGNILTTMTGIPTWVSLIVIMALLAIVIVIVKRLGK